MHCKKENNERTINDIELFRKCLHDIRNMNKIDKEMIFNIKNMSNEDKMEIIIACLDVIDYLKELTV